MSDQEPIDAGTRRVEEADAARAHGADRPPTADEERLAEKGAEAVDTEAVAEHEREMDELGADVKGEGEIT